MKRKCAAVLAAVMLAHAAPTWALDAASAQAYCDQVKQAAQDAQLRYVQTYQPRVAPVQTFDDAVGSCLEFISLFDIGFSFTIPSLGDIDAFLRNMAMKLLLRACQAATAQFNKAVNDAVKTVTDPINSTLSPLNSVPGVSAGMTTNASSGVGLNTGVTVGGSGGSTVTQAVQNATDRVINFVK